MKVNIADIKSPLQSMVEQQGVEQTLLRLHKYEEATRTDDKDSVMDDVNEFLNWCIKVVEECE